LSNELSKILLIGLPETGKTTFLAALWHTVYKSRCVLKLKELPEQSGYIKDIASKWVDCKSLGRTVQGVDQLVEMKLENSSTNEITELIFPDISGESFNSFFVDRQWTIDYEGLVSRAVGILFFVHPDKVLDNHLIQEANSVFSERDEHGNGSSQANENEIRWDSNNVPTQVKVVDLLQLHTHKSIDKTFKVAVIVSAWDVIQETITPKQWIEKRMPLLDQYLKANSDLIYFEVFGVSAQGGDIEEDKDSLLDKNEPYERIIAKDSDNNDISICEPIIWIKGT
jgi:hypothetical protein